jgi:hypothetical protein
MPIGEPKVRSTAYPVVPSNGSVSIPRLSQERTFSGQEATDSPGELHHCGAMLYLDLEDPPKPIYSYINFEGPLRLEWQFMTLPMQYIKSEVIPFCWSGRISAFCWVCG